MKTTQQTQIEQMYITHIYNYLTNKYGGKEFDRAKAEALSDVLKNVFSVTETENKALINESRAKAQLPAIL
jgi:hypothetical protein